jgi:hypothetical protein
VDLNGVTWWTLERVAKTAIQQTAAQNRLKRGMYLADTPANAWFRPFLAWPALGTSSPKENCLETASL